MVFTKTQLIAIEIGPTCREGYGRIRVRANVGNRVQERPVVQRVGNQIRAERRARRRVIAIGGTDRNACGTGEPSRRGDFHHAVRGVGKHCRFGNRNRIRRPTIFTTWRTRCRGVDDLFVSLEAARQQTDDRVVEV